MTKNKIFDLLCSLGISTKSSIKLFYNSVRDRDDVSVMKCRKSGVIFLSQTDHMDVAHYEGSKSFEYWHASDRNEALLNTREDDQRRFQQFCNIVYKKKWLDVGTGAGGILDMMSFVALETAAVEPQKLAYEELKNCGYKVYPRLDKVLPCKYDIVTMFHSLSLNNNSFNTQITLTKGSNAIS